MHTKLCSIAIVRFCTEDSKMFQAFLGQRFYRSHEQKEFKCILYKF